MTDAQKRQQLRKYKLFATGLFLLMAAIFIATTLVQKQNPTHWAGYVRAFAEAAMVGALADWFAVTALFHHPLGLKIPHTNLIQEKKDQIGDNLGNFVVDNFLSPENIRPYIMKLKVSGFAGEWLSAPANQRLLLHEASQILLDILNKLDDADVVNFISKKAAEMGRDVKINTIIGNGLDYILERGDHQRMVTALAAQVKHYILENEDVVRSRVQKESFSLIPKFVDDAIAGKITSGLANFFEEVAQDHRHSIRAEIDKKLSEFSTEIKTQAKWEQELRTVQDNFFSEEKLRQYAGDVWISVKKSLQKELSDEQSTFKKYALKNLAELSQKLLGDGSLQQKIDGWIRQTAYKYILKNTHQFGSLISSTVGNWQGKELSDKLELEVGKDLQFIRVNGTLVGGLVGLVIYTVTEFFLK